MKRVQKWLTTIGVVLAASAAPLATGAPQSATHGSTRTHASVYIPAGTVLNVRLTQTIDVDYASIGQVYPAVLDDPVLINGTVVIPRGAGVRLEAIAVKQSGTFKGSDRITLRASSISFGGRTYEVATNYVQTKSRGQGKRTAKNAGIGAGIGAGLGALFGGGSGAAVGAIVGGGAGTVVAAQKSEHLRIPAETRMQFQLNSAVRVRR